MVQDLEKQFFVKFIKKCFSAIDLPESSYELHEKKLGQLDLKHVEDSNVLTWS